MGFENAVGGGVAAFPGFQARFFPHLLVKAEAGGDPFCRYDDPTLQIFLSSVYLASVCGALSGSIVTPRLGRRATMMMASVIFFCGAVLQGAAMNVAMVVIGRVFLGFGMGAADQVGPQFLAEMAPPWLRGLFNSMFQFQIIFGMFIANVVNFTAVRLADDLGWRIALGVPGAPAIVLFIGALLLPDSPNSLAERGKNEEAERVLKNLRGVDDVAAELDDILAAAALADGHRQWRALLSRRYRPQFIITVLMLIFQVLCGFHAVLYAPQLFESLGAGHGDALKNTMVIGAVFVAFTLVGVFLADRVGRIPLFQSSGFLSMLAMATLGGLVGAVTTGRLNLTGAQLSNAVLAVVCVYVAAFAWGWAPCSWMSPAELTPLDARAAATALAVATNHLTCFVIAQLFLSMLCAMRYGLFIFFAGWMFIMLWFIQYCVPESRGCPVEEVYERLFEPHPLWGRFARPAVSGKAVGGGSGKAAGVVTANAV